MLSVVIPAYNEAAMIPKAAAVIDGLLEQNGIEHELLFIDDGSTDRTWQMITASAASLPSVRGVRFSRNFGKEGAIMAGLTEARGDCAVVIDCDLQHPPEKIIEMYSLWEQGYEVIEGKKDERGQESAVHRFAAKTFYELISRAAKIDMQDASDFKLLDRKAIDVIINMRERNMFFRALSSWVGFRTATVRYEVQDREFGESKWSGLSLVRYAISNISSFSTAPMQLVTILGVLMFIASVVLGVIALTQKVIGKALEGFTTVILIQLFSGSVLMMSLGIIGYYIARIYEEIKDRPRYIISGRCGEDDRE